MAPEIEKQDNFPFFQEKYSRPQSPVARQVERAVLGDEVSLNGYTTTRQAEELRDHLKLTVNNHLLDVGAGRGWPGLHIAQRFCGLVLTDIPLAALREAQTNIKARGLQATTRVVAADGRALPFRSAYFDGIVHADVFC